MYIIADNDGNVIGEAISITGASFKLADYINQLKDDGYTAEEIEEMELEILNTDEE